MSLKNELDNHFEGEWANVLVDYELKSKEDAKIAWEILEDVCGLDSEDFNVGKYSKDMVYLLEGVLEGIIGGIGTLEGINDCYVTDSYVSDEITKYEKFVEKLHSAHDILNS